MKALRKLLAGTILVALAAFGLTALTSSSNDPATTPVFGFTDKYCSSEHYKWFENIGVLIAADCKTDPDATGEDKDKIWYWRSYVEEGDYSYTCHLVEYREVKSVGVQPKKKKPITGGGGGGEETQPPAPQEPIPQKTKADKQADNLTKDEADDLQECWESKATGISVEIKDWNSDAIGATEADWRITKGQPDRGLGETTPYVNEVEVEGEDEPVSVLSIDVQIYPHGIARKIADTAHQDTFKHTLVYSQMHETFHVGQIKAIFDATGALPKPYEWWDLEVKAHNGTSLMYRTLYGKKAGVPSLLLDDNEEMTEDYKNKMEDYKALEVKKANGTITKAEEGTMEQLATWLKNPKNLPQATANNYYKPDKVKNFECD